MERDEGKKTESGWVSLVQERVRQAEDWESIKQIMVQVSYFLGNQWIYWQPTEKRVTLAPQDDGQERITFNVIKPRVMAKLAKQTKNRIKYDVVPDSNDQERIEIAKAAGKFLDYWWEQQEMDRKTRDIYLNNNVKGWCALKVYFDPQAGDDITPRVGEIGYEEGMEPIRTGEVKARVCDPLTLYIDPSATTDDEIRWIVERKPRDVDYIKEVYGKDVAPDENVEYVQNYNAGAMTIGKGTTKKQRNMVMVDEMWVAPCSKYPRGLKVTVAGGMLLDVNEKAGSNPYFLFGDIPIPGSVKYDAFIRDMLPVQKQINIIRTMMATHAKRMGNSIWALPHGADVDEDELTNEISTVIHFSPQGGRPERIGPPDLPSFYDRIVEYATRDIDDMSGAREITQGRLPAGLDTLGGLELMVEQENEKLAVSAQNYERGMKRALKRVLELMKKHYTEERMAKILGKDNEIELVAFTGSDLSGGEDINIVQGSSLPEMKAAQQDRIMTMWGAGAIVDENGQPDHRRLLRLMGMGDSQELFEQRRLDENKARSENRIFQQMGQDQTIEQALAQFYMRMEQYNAGVQQVTASGQDPAAFGLQPPTPPQGLPIVRDFYDHVVHIEEHNIFRKSEEYEQLPPNVQRFIDEHVQEHVNALQAPMQAQQQAEQQAAEQQAAQQQAIQEEQMALRQADEAQQTARQQMDMQKHNDNMQIQMGKLGVEAMRAMQGRG
ncbi:portal protein [Brevibacillus brevis]|uniref:portal protein n=1 Tax=Brevibacillus brevis TaxID=1393 RepID=UPI0031B82249